MISYGARLSDFKRSVIQYITNRTKEPFYKNDPNLLRVYPSGSISAVCVTGETKLELCSIERLCNIADRLHFQPLGELIKAKPNERNSLARVEKKEVATIQTTDMEFEIKSNIPLPGQTFVTPVQIEKKEARKNVNYRALPLKDMKVGDCIILHQCTEKNISNKCASAKTCIDKFVAIMDTKKKFKVAKTNDLKVGVWRIE